MEITNEIELEILEFCEHKVDEIDPYVLKDSLVLRNELVDFFFLMSFLKLERDGDYRLTYEELNQYFILKQGIENTLSKVRNGGLDITAIEKNSNLIIKLKK